jgi:hypothetical protein
MNNARHKMTSPQNLMGSITFCWDQPRVSSTKIDETLPNFTKRKHPRKGEEKKQGARTKVQASQTAQKRQATRR